MSGRDADALIGSVEDFIEKHALMKKGDRVIVGLSGGPDSMVLLHLLHDLAPRLSLELLAAHLHHGLRGRDADRDRELARLICRSLKIPFTSRKSDVRAAARRKRLSIEDAGRRARYAFFRSVCRRCRMGVIALGHTADDQVETFLMRLLRGAGGRGLAAMAPARAHGDLTIVRPLIGTWRREIIAYARAHGIPYREDRSNRDLSFLRNRVRRRLIPYLERRYNPAVKETVRRAAEIIGAEHSLVEEEAGKLFREAAERRGDDVVVSVKKILSAPPPLAAELVRRAVAECVQGGSASSSEVRAVLDLCRKEGGVKERRLACGAAVVKEYGSLVLSAEPPDVPPRYEVPLEDGLEAAFAPFPVRFSVAERGRGGAFRRRRAHPGLAGVWMEGGGPAWPLVERFSLDAIGAERLSVRNRRPGDRYRPIGMEGEKKLKDIMIDEKLPASLRGRVPLIASREGIVWLVGYRIADRYRVTSRSRRILEVRVEKVSPM